MTNMTGLSFHHAWLVQSSDRPGHPGLSTEVGLGTSLLGSLQAGKDKLATPKPTPARRLCHQPRLQPHHPSSETSHLHHPKILPLRRAKATAPLFPSAPRTPTSSFGFGKTQGDRRRQKAREFTVLPCLKVGSSKPQRKAGGQREASSQQVQ